LNGDSNLIATLNMLCNALTTLLCASLSYYLIEKPGQKLGKMLRSRLAQQDLPVKEVVNESIGSGA
jgi:peptidoglycan/LPS O-acetylase OafA/YrhL